MNQTRADERSLLRRAGESTAHENRRNAEVRSVQSAALHERSAAASTRAAEFRESWRILCVGLVGLAVGLVPGSAAGVFILPLCHYFGWSLSMMSASAVFGGLGAIFAGPLQGLLLDRFGFRCVVLTYIPLSAISVAATCLITRNIWTLYLISFIGSFVGSGCVMYYVRALSSWFEAGRGTAIGLVFAAGGLGCTLGPCVAQYMLDEYGWRLAYLSLAAIVTLAWPFSFAWLRDRGHLLANRPTGIQATANGCTRRDAAKTPAFWLIISACLLSGLADGGLFFLVPFFNENGMSQRSASYCLSLLFAASGVVQPLLGLVNDRLSAPLVAASAYLLYAAVFVAFGLAGSRFAVLESILAGVAVSGVSNSLFNIIPRFFGLKSFGEISGLIQAISAIAGMIGPVAFSLLRDTTGSYTAPYLAASTVAAGASFCMMLAARWPMSVSSWKR